MFSAEVGGGFIERSKQRSRQHWHVLFVKGSIDDFVNSFSNGNRVSILPTSYRHFPFAHNHALSAQMYVTAPC
jgi:hypothetical protein